MLIHAHSVKDIVIKVDGTETLYSVCRPRRRRVVIVGLHMDPSLVIFPLVVSVAQIVVEEDSIQVAA